MPEPKKRKMLCPDCETEVEITRDSETGDDEGVCPNPECRLNLGRIITRRRYDNASSKIGKAEEDAAKKSKKGKSGGSNWF